jgi:single-stranded DNA-binding protein
MLKVTFTGNLLADPEMNYAQNDRGTEYVKLRVALNKKKGENKLFAVADVTVFKFTQEANERLHTGSRVLITGDGFPDFYEQKDGTVVAKLDVVADAWEDLSPREGNGQGQGQGRTQPQQQQQQNGGYGRRPAQNGNGNGRTGGGNNRPRTGGSTDRRPARQF